MITPKFNVFDYPDIHYFPPPGPDYKFSVGDRVVLPRGDDKSVMTVTNRYTLFGIKGYELSSGGGHLECELAAEPPPEPPYKFSVGDWVQSKNFDLVAVVRDRQIAFGRNVYSADIDSVTQLFLEDDLVPAGPEDGATAAERAFCY